KTKGPVFRQALLFYPVTGGLVRALVRQAGRTARLDGQRPPAGRAPGMARVNPDPSSDVKTDPMVGFLFCGIGCRFLLSPQFFYHL
ncbi:hypothetical protein, partial [Aeromonas dhakensis]|uniref:hypothetical protein n=1 Tax=Aeromonas dhakensis TaxID=196024 RepID=UPI001E360E4E